MPSREWIIERLTDYRACRSHREVAAIEAMFAEFIAGSRAVPAGQPENVNRIRDIPQTHETNGD